MSFKGCPGLKLMQMTYILVYGKGSTNEEYIKDHDDNLTKLLEQVQALNLKLNKKKLKLRLSEVISPDLQPTITSMPIICQAFIFTYILWCKKSSFLTLVH